MTAHIAIYGRLGYDPKAIETRNGKPMAAATIAVEIGQDGEEREQLQVIAESIISARTVRPGGVRKRTPADTGNSAGDPAREKGGELVDEAIPF